MRFRPRQAVYAAQASADPKEAASDSVQSRPPSRKPFPRWFCRHKIFGPASAPEWKLLKVFVLSLGLWRAVELSGVPFSGSLSGHLWASLECLGVLLLWGASSWKLDFTFPIAPESQHWWWQHEYLGPVPLSPLAFSLPVHVRRALASCICVQGRSGVGLKARRPELPDVWSQACYFSVPLFGCL